ncbi:CmcJ/NvfI family oxidoreductase [Novosphingobium bradum]|uniref:CmcJ/NvfI family oxidoreductase n=1 Tax=Novosphingobium bradum TaxID=1737444 RepID=A0ABV7IL28_9SPHN
MTTALLNFAGDRSNGGIWSNTSPSRTTQVLTGACVVMADARQLSPEADLEREGFRLVEFPVAGADFLDPGWVAGTYMAACAALVARLTGAFRVVPVHPSVVVRNTGDSAFAPAAQFVHIDQDRGAARAMVAIAAGEDRALQGARRTAIYNVWRALTPPPQDVPLALCDQRSAREADWVTGQTIEDHIPAPIPYVSSVADPGQRWFHYPDMTLDEALVFKNYDSDPTRPLGCLHGAFRLEGAPATSVPRASAEARMVAFFA